VRRDEEMKGGYEGWEEGAIMGGAPRKGRSLEGAGGSINIESFPCLTGLGST
jgi:hypothetical protein